MIGPFPLQLLDFFRIFFHNRLLSRDGLCKCRFLPSAQQKKRAWLFTGGFMKKSLFILVVLFFLLAMAVSGGEVKKEFKIPFEQYQLANGLDVILHVDKSDPIATVYVCYHVGSNREKKGKTGFAHLFEHIMFQESQHIPQDQFFKKIQGAGGTLNGSTSNDRTNYFETVPKNALEMALWMEADRMGFL
jgi:zinc protease